MKSHEHEANPPIGSAAAVLVQPLLSVQQALPLIIYVGCALHICRTLADYTYIPRMARSRRRLLKRSVICVGILNAVILWFLLLALADRWLDHCSRLSGGGGAIGALVPGDATLTWQQRLGRANKDGRVLLMFTYGLALTAASVAYYLEVQAHLRTIYRTYHHNRLDATEMGRCVYFLLLPPSSAMQQLFTMHDYWASAHHSGYATTPFRRRSTSLQLQQQQRNDMPLTVAHSQRQLVCVSDTTGKSLRRKPLPALPEAADIWLARITAATPPTEADGHPDDDAAERTAAAVIGAASLRPTLPMRRCMSLESMPSFRFEDFN